MVEDITSEDYQEQFQNNPDADFVLVDVRELWEFEEGHIANAIHIPMSLFQSDFEDIPDDKAIVIVCARGNRSAMAGDFLVANGYDEVYNLIDGTVGWMGKGFPLE